MYLDQIAVFLQGALVVMGGLSLLVLAERADGSLEAIAAQPATAPGSLDERAAQAAGMQATEVFPLTMFAIGGMMIFCSAADLLTMFVALEVFSLPLYIMCGVARHRRLLSQEASLKYFLLGAFSSAIFLFGVALIYGITGSVNILQISAGAQRVLQANPGLAWTTELPMLVIAMLMMVVGLLFKVGAVPFHSWTPDVYMGAPTPVTGFMAACTKAAAFGALLRLLVGPLPTTGVAGFGWSLQNSLLPALVIVAALSMLIGSLVAIRQQDVKRMLGYSAIAHTGFILTGVASFTPEAVRGTLFYLLAYGLGSVAAFGIVTLIREKSPDGSIGPEATNLNEWNGLAARAPWLAAGFTVLLLSFAGIPLTAGFVAKYGALSAAVASGRLPLVVLAVIGVICSVIAASFYLRVIVRMYFSSDDDSRDGTVVVVGPLTAVAVTAGIAATVMLGVFPAPFLDWAGAILAAP
jgi:NADH-quinone oxidoreductase subunit N